MPEMIPVQYSASGATLYALARNSVADVWDTVVLAYVPYAAVDLANYVLPMAEQGASAFYTATLPAGTWHVSVFVQGGGSPAEGDVLAGGGVHVTGAVWEALEADHTGSGSFGGVLSSANAGATDAAIRIGVPLVSLTIDIAAVKAAVSPQSIAEGVWDALTAGHVEVDSFGELVQAVSVNAADAAADASALVTTIGTPANVTVSADIAAIAAAGGGVPQNQPLDNFTFQMASSADHVSGATGLTVTAQRSLDGAAFAACANAVTELGAGFYTIDLTAADMDGDIVVLLFTAATADARSLTIKTS